MDPNTAKLFAESAGFINVMIASAIPIILGALSGIISERSGIVNIGIEGMMLSGAFSSFMANVFLSQPGVSPFFQDQPIRLGLAILAACAIGVLMAMLHALLSIRFKVDQIISGTVINILAVGLTGYLYIGATTARRALCSLFATHISNNPGTACSVSPTSCH